MVYVYMYVEGLESDAVEGFVSGTKPETLGTAEEGIQEKIRADKVCRGKRCLWSKLPERR